MSPLLEYVLVMSAVGLVLGLALRLAGSQEERPKDAALIFFAAPIALNRIANLRPARRRKKARLTASTKEPRAGTPKQKRRPRSKTSV